MTTTDRKQFDFRVYWTQDSGAPYDSCTWRASSPEDAAEAVETCYGYDVAYVESVSYSDEREPLVPFNQTLRAAATELERQVSEEIAQLDRHPFDAVPGCGCDYCADELAKLEEATR